MTILYTTLQKLAFNHAVNLQSAGADVGLLRCLQADCRAAGAAAEMRDAAAELLLQLSTPNAASATPTCAHAHQRRPRRAHTKHHPPTRLRSPTHVSGDLLLRGSCSVLGCSGPLVRLVVELQCGAVSCASSTLKLGVSEVVAAKASQWLRDGGHEALIR